MTDYRKMPLGPLGPGRIGEIVECPVCHKRGLQVEDYVNPSSGSREKETICLHFLEPVTHQKTENERTITSNEIVEHKCRIPKPKLREDPQ